MPKRNRIFLKAFLPLGLLVMAALAIVRRRGPDDWEYERAEEERERSTRGRAAATRRRPASASRSRRRSPCCSSPERRSPPAPATRWRACWTRTSRRSRQRSRAPPPEAEAAPDAEARPRSRRARSRHRPKPPPGGGSSRRRSGRGRAGRAAPAAEPAAEAAPEAAAAEPAAEAAAVDRRSAGCRAGRRGRRSSRPLRATSSPPAPARAAAAAGARREARAGSEGRTRRRSGSSSAQPLRRRRLPRSSTSGHGEPTIWLNRALPDPTPASARLTGRSRGSSRDLEAPRRRLGRRARRAAGAGRARLRAGDRTRARHARRPAGRADAWKGALALSGRTSFADRADAFADLYRFVGLEALVTGFAAAKDRLAEAAARRRGRLSTGAAARTSDAGRIDVRVIVLIGYLAERHGSVTVSSLFSGHRKFSRPGVVSAHIYGHAVDIAAVGGTSIAGQPAAGRHHRGRRSVGAPPPRRAPAAAGHLTARPGRPVVPAARSRRPHPRWLLGPSSLDPPGRARRLRALARGGASAPADARPARPRGACRRRGDPASPRRLDSHVLHALPDRRRLPRPRRRRRRDRAGARAVADGRAARRESRRRARARRVRPRRQAVDARRPPRPPLPSAASREPRESQREPRPSARAEDPDRAEQRVDERRQHEQEDAREQRHRRARRSPGSASGARTRSGVEHRLAHPLGCERGKPCVDPDRQQRSAGDEREHEQFRSTSPSPSSAESDTVAAEAVKWKTRGHRRSPAPFS